MSQPVLLGIPIGSQAHRYGYSRVSEAQASRRHGKGDLEESPEIDVINSRDWSDESSQCVKMLGSIPVAEVDRPCRRRSRTSKAAALECDLSRNRHRLGRVDDQIGRAHVGTPAT